LQSSTEHFEVVNVLRKFAKAKRSPALAQLAARISTVMVQAGKHGVDPFQKVRDMITGMVKKMKNEASAAATQKDHCDKEKAKSQTSKETLGLGIEKQSAVIDKVKATHAGLAEEAAALQKQLAEIASEQADAAQIRQEEKATYASLKPELQQGMAGIRKALEVLHKQYGDGSNTGPMKTVFSLLEVVEEDTSKSLAKAEVEEAAAAAAFAKTTEGNKNARSIKEENVKYTVAQSRKLAKALS